jgi:hypothetical protein
VVKSGGGRGGRRKKELEGEFKGSKKFLRVAASPIPR